MATEKFVMPKPLKLPEVVDELGRLKFEIEKRVKKFKALRTRLFREAKKNRVSGEDYIAMITKYDKKYLSKKKLAKFLAASKVKLCYSTTPAKRLTIKVKA